MQRGVVAVIVRRERLLVIRRSCRVVAPRALCFPGGAIEPGESESDALRREINEELGAVIEPRRRLWQSTTPWDVDIAWWHAYLPADANMTANPAEVESIHWMSVDELHDHDELLPSNRDFLDVVVAGKILIDGLHR